MHGVISNVRSGARTERHWDFNLFSNFSNFYVYVLLLTYLCIYTSHKLIFPHKMGNCNFHLQKGQPHCNTMSWSDTKWHPVTKSMFGLLFRGESVRVEFFGFWPDLRIMMYGIDRSYNSGTFRYVDLAYFQILNAYPVSPAKYKRVNLIKLWLLTTLKEHHKIIFV